MTSHHHSTHTSSCLNDENRHVRDARIIFTESDHSYLVDGKRADISITGFKDLFMAPFDSEKVLKFMFRAKTHRFPKEVENHHKIPLNKPGSDYHGKIRQDVLKFLGAAELGTEFHNRIDGFLSSRSQAQLVQLLEEKKFTLEATLALVKKGDEQEMHIMCEQFCRQMHKLHKEGWVPYRTEWRIWFWSNEVCPSLSYPVLIAGSVDAMFQSLHDPKKFCLVDWKVSKKDFTSTYFTQNEVLYGPFRDMANHKVNQYAIQTESYRFAFCKIYGMDVVESRLVQFRPGPRTEEKVYKCPSLLDKIQEGMVMYCNHQHRLHAIRRWNVPFLRSRSRILAYLPELPHAPYFESEEEYNIDP